MEDKETGFIVNIIDRQGKNAPPSTAASNISRHLVPILGALNYKAGKYPLGVDDNNFTTDHLKLRNENDDDLILRTRVEI